MRFFTVVLLLGACATESTIKVSDHPVGYAPPVAVECTSLRLTRPNDPAVLVNCPSTVVVVAPVARSTIVTARPTAVVTQPRVPAPPATLQTHSFTPSPTYSHPAMSSPAVVSHPTATTPTATSSTPTVHHR